MKDDRDIKIEVIKIGKPKDKWLVTPGKVHVAMGEEVIFEAEGTAAIVLIPKSRLFEPPAAGNVIGDVLTLDVGRGSQATVKVKSAAKTGRVERPTPIECRYAVYCVTGEDFAEGNSSPVMLIEPPS